MEKPSEELAKEFREVGDVEAERKAKDGYWGDFTSPLATPQLDLYTYAIKMGYQRIADGVKQGRFDG